jgi:hypothetical protein
MQVVCLFLLFFFVIVNMVSVKSTINIRGISVVVDNVVQESYMIYDIYIYRDNHFIIC